MYGFSPARVKVNCVKFTDPGITPVQRIGLCHGKLHRVKPLNSFLLLILLSTASPLAQTVAAPGIHPISGRRVANVMGWQGAEWLERAERAREEEPDKALDALGPLTALTVADVGAGSGYFTVRLAARVGATGRVYANDLQPEMLKMLAARLAREHVRNVTLVPGAIDDPRLPASSIDVVLMVDVYHELSEPQKMLRALRSALKPGGRLVLLEYRKEDPEIPIRFEHKMSVAEVKMELEAEGFILARVDDRLPRQHILIFSK
jgi:SAM-dependent methyltransferase